MPPCSMLALPLSFQTFVWTLCPSGSLRVILSEDQIARQLGVDGGAEDLPAMDADSERSEAGA